MYKDIFKRILTSSETCSLTFFVGAGISALSKAPKWSDLLSEICKQIDIDPKEKYTSDESLQIPQIYYCSINKDEKKYYSFIQSLFNKHEILPNEIHKKIFDLNPESIITTNFDQLLENAATYYCKGYRVIACDDEIPNINGNKFILKLHGDFKHRNIVFKEEDYLNYSEKFKLTETILKSVFSTNTVVFIGYGLNDYNIKLILNWAKSLLKDKFNKPIFIYTDDKELSASELQYQEDKGLVVIQYQKLLANKSVSNDFSDRYKIVLDSINNASQLDIHGKDEDELFNVLYELVKPLNRFYSLKTQDLQRSLHPYVIVEEDGTILVAPDNKDILKYYIKISEMDIQEKSQLSKDTRQKYDYITSVFSKARVRQLREERSLKKINGIEYEFAESKCIHFDYKGMNKFIQNNSDSLQVKYQKAYYLAKLNKYQESLNLFSEVAKESYYNNDFFLYYLSQVNRNNLISAMKSVNGSLWYFNYYDLNGIEKDERVFEELPVEFQVEYANFKDLNSVNLLYKNSYESFIEGQKLSHSIESNTFEMGFTSSDKVICRINNNLHFLLGNGIYVDEFSEFKNTIKNLMSLLVHKYSVQNKLPIYDDMFSNIAQEKISFDEVDFYCFIEYFGCKEIVELFKKYQIDVLEFSHPEKIEKSIRNLMNYYNYLIKSEATERQRLPLQLKLKNCLALLKYVNLSQKIVNEICNFIFKYEFREILIDDKILFIDSQIHRHKKYSDITKRIISDKLFYYMDMHIKSIQDGNSFELLSSHTGMSYSNLIYYVDPNDKTVCSNKLALRISRILKNEYSQMYKAVYNYYFDYLSTNQKNKIIKWAKLKLKTKFDFGLFAVLIQGKVKINKILIELLKNHLRLVCNQEEKSGIQVYPKRDKFDDLKNVGYWIHIGLLPKKEFEEFIGINDNFDFYYLYEKFNFEKFDITWLFNLYPNTYKSIIENDSVKEKIRKKISEVLMSKTLNDVEQNELTSILLKWFC
ncbi:SIR2 family protein [Paludicola sp. MB14-C6]|uniref:SIR2 family protein n=1 Tax=Paludihabitans sp. MB14-C6 TaxID=3070656 RepID=UPI0027DDEBC4|nr:SIR2 family protein [Paludicola sp. MB14-C6]WMJ22673.1 SIR2 family protein [Paludicola sp. MB14-C6]